MPETRKAETLIRFSLDYLLALRSSLFFRFHAHQNASETVEVLGTPNRLVRVLRSAFVRAYHLLSCMGVIVRSVTSANLPLDCD